MSSLKQLSATLAIACAAANFSQAAPVSLQLTLTNSSSLVLFLEGIDGLITTTVPFDLNGTLDVTLDSAIDDAAVTNDTSSISFDDANIGLSDETFDLSLGFLPGVEGEFFGLGINTLDSNDPIPLTTTGPSDPFSYTFDPGEGSPTQVAIDQGIWTYASTFPVSGFGSLDFSSDPIEATVDPVGQIGFVTQDATLTGNTLVVDVLVSAPLSFSDLLITDPLNIDANFAGALVATGSYTTIVPEPSSLILLGVAAAGLVPLWRRLRR